MKRLNCLAVFLLAGISTTIAEPAGSCSGSVTYLDDTVNCSIYYQCIWGDPVEMYCPSGLHFNTKLHVCDWPYNAGCISDNISMKAPVVYSTTVSHGSLHTGCTKAKCPYYYELPSFFTYFPHDTDCNKYCMCDFYSAALAMSCPDGLYWNTNLDTCDRPEKVHCLNSPSSNITTTQATANSFQSTTDKTSDNTKDLTTKVNLASSTTSVTETSSTGIDSTTMRSTTVAESKFSMNTTPVMSVTTNPETTQSTVSSNYATETTSEFSSTVSIADTHTPTEASVSTTTTKDSASSTDSTTDISATTQDTSKSTITSDDSRETILDIISTAPTTRRHSTTEVSLPDTTSDTTFTSFTTVTESASFADLSTDRFAVDFIIIENNSQPIVSSKGTTEKPLEFSSTVSTTRENIVRGTSSTGTPSEGSDRTFKIATPITSSAYSTDSTIAVDYITMQESTQSIDSMDETTETTSEFFSTGSTVSKRTTREVSFDDIATEESGRPIATDSVTDVPVVDSQSTISSEGTTETILDIFSTSSTPRNYPTTEVSFIDTSTKGTATRFTSFATVNNSASSPDSTTDILGADLTTTQQNSQSTVSLIYTTPTNFESSSTASTAYKDTTTETTFTYTVIEENDLTSTSFPPLSSSFDLTTGTFAVDVITKDGDSPSTVSLNDLTDTTLKFSNTVSTVREVANTEPSFTVTSSEARDRTSTAETSLQSIGLTLTAHEDTTTESSVTEALGKNSDITTISFTTAPDAESLASSTLDISPAVSATTDKDSQSTVSLDNSCTNVNCRYYPPPPANVTIFPSTDCTKYCVCDWYGEVHVMNCPYGLYWNNKLYTCDWPFNVHCVDSLTTEVINSMSTTPTLIEEGTNTSESSTTKIESEVTTGSTTDASSVSETSSSNSCSNVTCPYYPEAPANVTIFPHDTDCTKYCMCDWYLAAHVMNCPAGLVWSSALYTCDFSFNVDCNDSSTTEVLNSETTTVMSTGDSNNPTIGSTAKAKPEVTTGSSTGESDAASSTAVACSASSTGTTINVSAVEYTTTQSSQSTVSADYTTEKALEFSSTVSTGHENTTTKSTILDFTRTENMYQSTVSSNNGCSNVQCPHDHGLLANATFFPFGTDCTKYCICDWNSSAHVMSCPDGLYWNSNLNVCDLPSNVHCGSSFSAIDVDHRNTTQESSKESDNTIVRGIIDGNFKHSSFKVSITASTNFSTTGSEHTSHFITSLQTSSTINEMPAIYLNSSTIDPYSGCGYIHCSYDFGQPITYSTFHPYISDPTKFCMCDWVGRLYLMRCPKGLYWNNYLAECNWPSNNNYGTDVDTKAYNKKVNPLNSKDDKLVTKNARKDVEVKLEGESIIYPVAAKHSLSEHGCSITNCPYFRKPPVDITYFAYNNDCRKFCVCNWDGSVFAMNCAEGLYWNREGTICDSSAKVQC